MTAGCERAIVAAIWTAAYLGLRSRGKPTTPGQRAWTSARWIEVYDLTDALGYPSAPQTWSRP